MRTGTGPETTSWTPLITSTAWLSKYTGRGDKVLFRETEKTTPIRQGRRVNESASMMRLSASRRPSTHQMVADRSGMLNGLRGRRGTVM